MPIPPRSADIPTQPGCYVMRNSAGEILYIGKAKQLRRRVSSYWPRQWRGWQHRPHDEKTTRLLSQVTALEFFVTRNEVEALILEARLIKQHQPPYNLILKDNQPYGYIQLTDEPYPRLVLTRQLTARGTYFGPFTSGQGRRALLLTAARLFGLRTGKLQTHSSRELYRLLNTIREERFGQLTPEQYTDNVRLATLFLRGKKDALLKVFHQRMQQAAAEQNYELAKLYRDQLQALTRINQAQLIALPKQYDQDVINYATSSGLIIWQILHIVRGLVTSKQEYRLADDGSTRSEQLAGFMRQYYLTRQPPPEIIVPEQPEEATLLVTMWQELHGRRIRLVVPRRGQKHQLLELVRRNITAQLPHDPLSQLQSVLNLPESPEEIDCFDISNISGQYAVGSCVRFSGGRPNTALYRRFRIKTVRGSNDFAMLAEVIGRRYRPEHTAAGWSLPQLIVIDGGKGQLTAGQRALRQLRLTIPAIGLAKKREEIFLAGRSTSLQLPRTESALKLLQQLRDEAHRFAVRYHTTVRRQAYRSSAARLEKI